jgi:hypothetical protein
VDNVPDQLLLIKFGSAGTGERDFWTYSQDFSPLDHRSFPKYRVADWLTRLTDTADSFIFCVSILKFCCIANFGSIYSVTFRPQANCTDWATAAGRRILEPNFSDRGLSHDQCGGPLTVVNLSFLDRSRYFFIQVAPHISSWGWADPVLDPLLLGKSRSAGNRTRVLWICGQELWPLDHRSGSSVVLIYLTAQIFMKVIKSYWKLKREFSAVLNQSSTMQWWCMGMWRYNSFFLVLNSSWRYVVVSRPGRITPEEIFPGSHWIGD